MTQDAEVREPVQVRRPAPQPGTAAPAADVPAEPRMAIVASGADRARDAADERTRRYGRVAPEDSDVVVALGGDGFLLHAMHDFLPLGRPIFGMNRGTVGFLLNSYRPDDLARRVAAATRICVHPLAMTAR